MLEKRAEATAKESEKQEMVTLESLSDLTGFPVKMIKEELFTESQLADETVSLSDLRKAMMVYLDKTMMSEETTSAEV